MNAMFAVHELSLTCTRMLHLYVPTVNLRVEAIIHLYMPKV